MNVYPIIAYDNDILRKVSQDINENHPHLHELIEDMYLTMHKATGIGLSAIQIGLQFNLFIIGFTHPETKVELVETFINPKMIREFGDKVELIEGCLSMPTVAGSVKRHSQIEIEWRDRNWELKRKVFEGLEARVIQHEFDHLNGILFIDHLSNIWKAMLEQPLEMVKNKEIEVTYLQR